MSTWAALESRVRDAFSVRHGQTIRERAAEIQSELPPCPLRAAALIVLAPFGDPWEHLADADAIVREAERKGLDLRAPWPPKG